MSDEDRFVGYLESLARRKDRAALAKLRRGLGKPPGEVADVLPIIVPFLPDEKKKTKAYFLVGSLFAKHPESSQNGNMGDTYRRLGNHESAEKRFVALLDSHADELGTHLRHAIALASSEGVAVNYRQLLRDINAWQHPDKYVQLAWARSYWSTKSEAKNDEDSAPTGERTKGEK